MVGEAIAIGCSAAIRAYGAKASIVADHPRPDDNSPHTIAKRFREAQTRCALTTDRLNEADDPRRKTSRRDSCFAPPAIRRAEPVPRTTVRSQRAQNYRRHATGKYVEPPKYGRNCSAAAIGSN